MGQKSVMREALACLGTRVRMVLLVAEGMKDEKKKCWIEAVTSFPKIDHVAL